MSIERVSAIRNIPGKLNVQAPIVPLDGSRLSESCRPTVVHLAQKLHAAVTLVHVIEKNAPIEVHGEPHLSNPEEAEHYLDDVERRFFPPGLQVHKHVHKTAIANATQSIAEHAREFKSDLVVMSVHGRGGMRKLIFGSIAQQVVSTKVTPVLLIRSTEGGTAAFLSGRPFLVPLDGTAAREQALPVAASLASACGVDLKLLMVVPTLETLSGVETTSRILLPATTQECSHLRPGIQKRAIFGTCFPILEQMAQEPLHIFDVERLPRRFSSTESAPTRSGHDRDGNVRSSGIERLLVQQPRSEGHRTHASGAIAVCSRLRFRTEK